MLRLFLVGAGGFAGSVLRYLVGGAAQRLAGDNLFPWGTLAVNVLGCLVVGVISQFVDSRGAWAPETRALVVVGFIGGFTTFSAFGNETFHAVLEGDWWLAGLNVAANVFLGLGAVWLGYAAASTLTR